MNETTGMILEWVIKGAVVAVICLIGFAYTTYYERRFLARIQVRIGPNRAGPWGLLQPVADGIKLIFKEELVPDKAYKFAFMLAPVLTMAPAIIVMGVVPWGTQANFFGRTIELGISNNLNVGILYILSVTSIAVYGIVLAGWASNNKYAMLGGLRSTAQMISYELALGLSFLPPIMLAGSLSLGDIVKGQQDFLWYFIPLLPTSIVFFIAVLAEVNRSPFDMPEAEQELVAGYHTEYSGMKFALFFMGEYVKMFSMSAVFSTLFLGGFAGPFVEQVPWLGPVYLLIKIIICLGLMIWIRGTLPRFRYDRLMKFGWKILLPIALINVVLTALMISIFGL
ncbi:MAG: NADH-quinone oxidoreductase subunit NuoH [Anaerolineales bacterium]|nr:NADH-quinone oxidoreductase subunit NuoH [Anaerolineales bacterium]